MTGSTDSGEDCKAAHTVHGSIKKLQLQSSYQHACWEVLKYVPSLQHHIAARN